MKKVDPQQASQVVAMRTAGYTVASIAKHIGISISSVKRICQKNAVKPGEALDALVEKSMHELKKSLTSNESIKLLAASFMQDTVVHAEEIREVAATAAKHLKASNADEALKVMRACAAWANATKLSADALRSTIKIAPIDEGSEDLPELTISVLSDDDVNRIREEQRAEAQDLGLISEE